MSLLYFPPSDSATMMTLHEDISPPWKNRQNQDFRIKASVNLTNWDQI
jgi:hypothetical protein